MENNISGRTVLLIWSGVTTPEDIEEIVGKLKERVGSDGKVSVEHVDRLKLSSHTESSFDVIYSGLTFPSTFVHDLDILSEIARILKPSGSFTVREPTGNANNLATKEKLVSTLKLSGFVNISQPKPVNLTEEKSKELQKNLNVANDVVLTEISCEKPSFDVGASSKLSLSFNKAKKESQSGYIANISTLSAQDIQSGYTANISTLSAQDIQSDYTANIWTLSAQDIDDDEVDIIDSDELLDENDRKKPEPSSLKIACGPGNKAGKKKACKNCSCGLADDLAMGIEESQPKSACGSCYLGDAFRCASCPYLGMPAFKPGEKISLSDRQLKPDI